MNEGAIVNLENAESQISSVVANKTEQTNKLFSRHEFDSTGMAELFNDLYHDDFRHCDLTGWMVKKNRHWDTDSADKAVELRIEQMMKARRAFARDNKSSLKFTEEQIKACTPSGGKVAEVKHKISTYEPVTVTKSEFEQTYDAIPHYLNCVNGTIDLRTSELLETCTAEFTKELAVPFDNTINYTFIENFLFETLGNYQDTHEFFHMYMGYCLTGSIREEKSLYIVGPTRSGKGTWYEAFLKMLGAYAASRPFSTFMKDREKGDQGFDLADLPNIRFVAVDESSESGYINAESFKQYTGGNVITAAQKGKQPRNFVPSWKLLFVSNADLKMEVTDVAAWNRMQVLTFPNSRLGSEDKGLKEEFKTPEIQQQLLTWAVAGAKKWYNSPNGLVVPESSIVEKTRMRGLIDSVGNWVEDLAKITKDKRDFIPTRQAHESYLKWCGNGESPKKMKAFVAQLEKMGCTVGREYVEVTDFGGRPTGDRKQVRVLQGIKANGWQWHVGEAD